MGTLILSLSGIGGDGYGCILRRGFAAAGDCGDCGRGFDAWLAARRFAIGESTAGAWYRLWRATGALRARKQGRPGGGKLDPHEAFILALVAADKDISLEEIAERVRSDRGVYACVATVWHFFDKRNITVKKRPRMQPNSSARM